MVTQHKAILRVWKDVCVLTTDVFTSAKCPTIKKKGVRKGKRRGGREGGREGEGGKEGEREREGRRRERERGEEREREKERETHLKHACNFQREADTDEGERGGGGSDVR